MQIGFDTSIISKRHSIYFTGVRVSPRCQRRVSEGLSVPSLQQLYRRSDAELLDVLPVMKLHPLVYFCGDDDLIFINLTVKRVWLTHAAPLSLRDDNLPIIDLSPCDSLADNMPHNSDAEIQPLSTWQPHLTQPYQQFAAGGGPVTAQDARQQHPNLGRMVAAKRCLLEGARLSKAFKDVYDKAKLTLSNLTLSTVVGFGGRVSATVTGVLRENTVSSLIAATQLSRVQLREVALELNMGFFGTGVSIAGASTLHVVNSTLSRNVAVTFGGAIAAWPGSNVEIINSKVTNNLAAGGGGLCMVMPNKTEVVNTSFVGNCAIGGVLPPNIVVAHFGLLGEAGAGGAMWYVGNITTSFTTTLAFNFAAAGGGINSAAGYLTLNGCLLEGNWASKYGGALAIWKGRARVGHGNTFNGNTAQVHATLMLCVSLLALYFWIHICWELASTSCLSLRHLNRQRMYVCPTMS